MERHELQGSRRGVAIVAVLILSSALFISLSMVTRIAFLWRGLEREAESRNREAAQRIVIDP